MKHIGAIGIIFAAVFVISCASRPLAPVRTAGELRFDEAVQAIKVNSPLVKKHFEPRELIVSGKGFAAVRDIALKGVCPIDGIEYPVTYYFASAVKVDGNLFVIPFLAEDPESGLSHTDVLFWSPSGEDSGLLLSFDDTFWEEWRKYFDLFDAYGAKVTFFVQGSLHPDTPSGAENALVDFCFEAIKRGHGLGFHTVNHLNLTKVSRETFDRETIEAAQTFSKAGIHFSAFAYPFGFSEPWMHEALAPFFPVTRGYGSNIRLYDTALGNDGFIVSKAIDNILYRDDAKFENDVRSILLVAKFAGHCIVPFTSHEFSDKAEWGIKPARLEYLLKTAQGLKLKFYTYDGLRSRFAAGQGASN